MTRDTFKAKGTPPSITHHGFGLPPGDEPDYKITLKQLDNCEETKYEITKTSTARYLLGETMSRADAITLCDKHCVIISSTPKSSKDKDE